MICPKCSAEVELVSTENDTRIALELNPLGNIILERVDDADRARWLNSGEEPKDPLQPRYRAHVLHCTGRPS